MKWNMPIVDKFVILISFYIHCISFTQQFLVCCICMAARQWQRIIVAKIYWIQFFPLAFLAQSMLTMLGDWCKSWSSFSCNILIWSLYTSPGIFLSILLSGTCNSSFTITDGLSHPYKLTANFFFAYSNFIMLEVGRLITVTQYFLFLYTLNVFFHLKWCCLSLLAFLQLCDAHIMVWCHIFWMCFLWALFFCVECRV